MNKICREPLFDFVYVFIKMAVTQNLGWSHHPELCVTA